MRNLTAKFIWFYFVEKKKMDKLLSDSQTDRKWFFKLLALGLFDILVTLPIALIFLFETIFQHKEETRIFWPGWKATHSSISFVLIATWAEWKSTGWAAVAGVRTGQWTNPLFAVVFFALFGVREERLMWCRNMYWKIMRPLGFTRQGDLKTIVFGSGPAQGAGASGVLTATT